MDNGKNKLTLTEDVNIKQAYEKYELFKKEIEQWQSERGSYWSAMISLAEKPPYLSVLDLPSQAIIELWQRLNIVAKADINETALQDFWEQFKKGQNAMEAELSTRFHMAISGVAKLGSRLVEERITDTGSDRIKYYNSTECPVCGEPSTLAAIMPPEGHRMMQCTLCGNEWTVKRVGCLFCGSEDAKQQVFLQNEDYPGVEMVACKTCGQIFKEIDARELAVKDFLWEDLRTLPLNFAAKLWVKELENNSSIH